MEPASSNQYPTKRGTFGVREAFIRYPCIPMLNDTASWDAVISHLEAFVNGWGDGPPPFLSDHLPSGPPGIRRRVLVELVKADIDARLVAGCPRSIGDYCRDHPELTEQDDCLLEVIHEDFHLRRRHGEPVSIDAYCRDYPRLAEQIRRWCRYLDGASTISSSLAAAVHIPDFTAGQVIDDFLLIAKLGRGSFATVWLARQVSMSRMVALKVSGDRGEEAVTLAQLDHPHIVRVYDQRRLPELGVQLIYEQFLPGGTLAAVVNRIRTIPPLERSAAILRACAGDAAREVGLDGAAGEWNRPARNWPDTVAAIGIDLARALDHAHSVGVLHRDVKPANVLLGTDGSPHLVDFNTSCLAAHPAACAKASFGGSLAYMSPEHLEAFDPTHPRSPDDLDGRADLYSLAVTLWELLVGRRPFRDETAADGDLSTTLSDMITRRRNEAIDPSSMPTGDNCNRLEATLRHCLSPERDQRPISGAEMARRLAICLQPRASGLLSPALSGWRNFSRRHPFLAVCACVMLPNVVLGLFNYFSNQRLLLDIYSSPDRIAQQSALATAFERTAIVVNAVAFPLGMLFAWMFTRPIVVAMGLAKGSRSSLSEAIGRFDRSAVRRKTLWLGDAAAWIGVMEWLLAGIAFPIGIWLQIGSLAPEVPWLFMQSPIACGLVAAAYPFFLSSLLALRVFYPAQIPLSLGDAGLPQDEEALHSLASRSGFYLLIAGGVPLVTLGLLVILHRSTDRLSLALLTAAGLSGLLFASWARQAIHSDSEAIIAAGRPLDQLASESLTSSRR